MAMLQDGFNRRRNGQEVNWLRREGQGTAASAGDGRAELRGGQRPRDATSRRLSLQGRGAGQEQGLLVAPVPAMQQHGGVVALSAGVGDLAAYGR